MDHFVATIAKSDQVLLRIVASLTAELLMVNLELLHSPTGLTPPIVALQYLSTQLSVRVCVKPQTRSLRSNPVHDACGRTACRNTCCCCPDRNLKNRIIENSRVSGF